MNTDNRKVNNKKVLSEIHQLVPIALYIKESRFCYGLTQKKLAEDSNVHYRTIQNIESGKTNYSLKSLIKVISVFDLDLNSLFQNLA